MQTTAQILERFKVADADRFTWGHLVKDWIKGRIPRPGTLEELQAQCQERGISVSIPDYMKSVVFVQNDKSVLTVRLPAKDLVESGELNIVEREIGYPLPSFYEQFFCSPTANTELSPQQKLELHAARVGEYSVNSCA
jgi:hypothetical protein